MRIWNPWRLLALAAVMSAVCGTASAQTVLARRVPAGETLEVMLNGQLVGSATPDPIGDATLTFNMRDKIGKQEIDANIYVDRCETTHRVWIVELGTASPSQGTCSLRAATGIYWVRTVNTIVVNDITAVIPSLLLVKGSYTPPAPGEEETAAPSREAPGGGLVLFGGGGLSTVTDFEFAACGRVGECVGDESGIGFTAGAEFRFNRAISAEVSYIRPGEVTVEGGGVDYRFDAAQNEHVFRLVGKIGIPIGIARIYGLGGGVYNQAEVVTTQSTDARTITIDGTEVTFPAATQTIELETDGWGWVYGGGLEIWASDTFGFYGEFSYAQLKGEDVNRGEGKIDNKLITIFGGLRIHLGR